MAMISHSLNYTNYTNFNDYPIVEHHFIGFLNEAVSRVAILAFQSLLVAQKDGKHPNLPFICTGEISSTPDHAVVKRRSPLTDFEAALSFVKKRVSLASENFNQALDELSQLEDELPELRLLSSNLQKRIENLAARKNLAIEILNKYRKVISDFYPFPNSAAVQKTVHFKDSFINWAYAQTKLKNFISNLAVIRENLPKTIYQLQCEQELEKKAHDEIQAQIPIVEAQARTLQNLLNAVMQPWQSLVFPALVGPLKNVLLCQIGESQYHLDPTALGIKVENSVCVMDETLPAPCLEIQEVFARMAAQGLQTHPEEVIQELRDHGWVNFLERYVLRNNRTDYTMLSMISKEVAEPESTPLFTQLSLEDFKDPVTLELFENPRLLTCGHTISQPTIITICNDENSAKNCPTCRHPIEAEGVLGNKKIDLLVTMINACRINSDEDLLEASPEQLLVQFEENFRKLPSLEALKASVDNKAELLQGHADTIALLKEERTEVEKTLREADFICHPMDDIIRFN